MRYIVARVPACCRSAPLFMPALRTLTPAVAP